MNMKTSQKTPNHLHSTHEYKPDERSFPKLGNTIYKPRMKQKYLYSNLIQSNSISGSGVYTERVSGCVAVAQEAASPSPPGGGVASVGTSNGSSRTHSRPLSCLVSSGVRHLRL